MTTEILSCVPRTNIQGLEGMQISLPQQWAWKMFDFFRKSRLPLSACSIHGNINRLPTVKCENQFQLAKKIQLKLNFRTIVRYQSYSAIQSGHRWCS